ncbi:MAG: CHAD domain-containing protein [Pseudomonadota bacterium]
MGALLELAPATLPSTDTTVAVKAEPLALERKMTVEQAFGHIVRNCLGQMQSNHTYVATGNAPEALHQMRVGLRRLRSALRMFRPLLSLPDQLRDELAWLSEELGAARDWDVLASSTLPSVADDLPGDMELVLVRLAAEARADELRAAAGAAVSTERYVALTQNLAHWLDGAHWREASNAQQRRALKKTVSGFAHATLEDAHERLLKRGSKLRGAKAAARHRVRIAAKQARYATEFFHSLYPAGQVKPFVKALSGLQDELGWLNDAAVADGLLKILQHGEARLDGSAAFTRGFLASHVHHDDRKLRKLWKAFEPMALLG